MKFDKDSKNTAILLICLYEQRVNLRGLVV